MAVHPPGGLGGSAAVASFAPFSATMPHATPAWPQALPRGSGDAHPRVYHDPSDSRLWAPGRHAGRTPERRPPRPAACRRPAFRPRTRASAGFQNARASAGFQNARPRAPASNEIELRLYIIYINKGFPPFQHTAYLPMHASTCIASVAPPTACDRACRSLIACLASRPSISTKNIPTPFDTPSASPAPRPLAPLVHDSLRMGTCINPTAL